MTDEDLSRSGLPTNERVAILEAEGRNARRMLAEIKDAVVAINLTLRDVVRIEQRQADTYAAVERLHKGLEAERELRSKGDEVERAERIEAIGAVNSKIARIESSTQTNTYARGWLERLAVPLATAVITAASMRWFSG